MSSTRHAQGPWLHRFAIRLLTVTLAVLVYWLLGFLVDDIQSFPGPDYDKIEKAHLDPKTLGQRNALTRQVAELTRQIENEKEKQKELKDSTSNLEQTIGQLIELRKLGLEKAVASSDAEQTDFSNSLNLFLANQKKYQELSQSVAAMVERKQTLVLEQEQVEKQLARQRVPAREEYLALERKHRWKLAMLQLVVLTPILVTVSAWGVKHRASIYFPLYLAIGAATLLKVALVVHAYFPSKYFKYVLIGVLLVVVAKLLIHFIRGVAFPKTQFLLKQYREAYERFLCPVCDYPIRIGPRRFLFWTRRMVNKLIVSSERADLEETYTCPACGSVLFEQCAACHKVRHALLPNCSHCGDAKELSASQSLAG